MKAVRRGENMHVAGGNSNHLLARVSLKWIAELLCADGDKRQQRIGGVREVVLDESYPLKDNGNRMYHLI
jgi:hypothetical protein